MAKKNSIISKTNQVKIIWYDWKKALRNSSDMWDIIPTSLSGSLGESISYDISNHLIDFSFNKSMSTGAGSFTLTLGNSLDWAKHMTAGTWFLVFASPNGDLPLPKEPSKELKNSPVNDIKNQISSGSFDPSISGFSIDSSTTFQKARTQILPEAPSSEQLTSFLPYLRCICFIQRVGIASSVGADGELEITYKISGKDFGVALDETELWFNLINNTERGHFQALTASELGLPKSGRRLNVLLNLWTDAFLNTEKIVSSFKGRKQWLLPKQMLLDLGIPSVTHIGDIPDFKQFYNTAFENNQENPLNGLEGNAWSRLKSLSVPDFHELFTELNDDGLPRFYFRPIPWGIDQSNYESLAQTIDTYLSLTENDSSSYNKIKKLYEDNNIFSGGTNVSSFVAGAMESFLDPTTEFRLHRLDLKASELLSVDVGPDFHSHYNHFIVDATTPGAPMNVAVAILDKLNKTLRPFPFENTESINRFGFRPKHIEVAAWKQDSSGFGLNIDVTAEKKETQANANADFIKQINEVQLDYWGRSKYFYSGTFVIGGRPDLRLGKVFVTDLDIEALGNMVFYIEGYTDTITVDAHGTVDWIQTVMVTRGIELEDLESLSGFGKRQSIKALGTFTT